MLNQESIAGAVQTILGYGLFVESGGTWYAETYDQELAGLISYVATHNMAHPWRIERNDGSLVISG
jgi:hypothetical protein